MNQLKRDLNRSIKRVSIAVLILFLILLVNVNYLQAVEAPSLAGGPENPRAEYDQTQIQRGDIVTKINQIPVDSLDVVKAVDSAYSSKPGPTLFEVQRERRVSLIVLKP